MLRKKYISPTFICIVSISIGFVLGIVMDKEWLNDLEMSYIDHLEAEKKLLKQEKAEWIAYIEQEMNQIKLYTDKDNHGELQELFSDIGVTIDYIPESLALLSEPRGILITLGEEIEHTYDFPQLVIDEWPKGDIDLNILYVSLLKLKEELSQ